MNNQTDLLKDNAQIIGTRLYEARWDVPLSLLKVAQHLNLSIIDIDHIEKGIKPATPEQLVKLSNLYGVEIYEITRGKLPYDSPIEWMDAFCNGQITEGTLAHGLQVDRLVARDMYQNYLTETGRE